MSSLSVTPTASTKALMKKVIQQSPKIVQKAKYQGLVKASNIFKLKAVEEAPSAKGTLRKSILTMVQSIGDYAKIFSKLDYALFQEEGTGIYGSRKQPITPKRAKVLKFTSKSGKLIFAKSVKGVKPKKFMFKAYNYIKTKTKEVDTEIYNYLKKGLFQ